ncbi:MAG: single-stranded-DNA-specific exonuclease RecJ [Ruminococcus sp.]|nr:single-stranded-DNA-specific exonuclease RecJ [Ruminococcus sp.]MCD7799772.1 single-stranded-DNA-specific exonuclease RecJ [Ruminococcus sp.]
MKKWVAKSCDVNVVNMLVKETTINPLCASVITARGVTSKDTAVNFIQPCEIESPLSMVDMSKAIDVLNHHIDIGSKICIFGDYDCDGITSTAMLKTYLEFLGANVFTYIPERSEGYGMNINAIDKINEQGANLIITVDNGISAHNEAEYIYSLGMQLIVTDHHQPSETLPRAEAIVNPHRKDCPSKFKNLCGAGVVFKLIMALEGNDYNSVLEQFGDLVAIATIGDVVEISGENRKLVHDGLQYIKDSDRIGILALSEVANIDLETIDSTKVAFGIVPRINASGRFGSPKTALALLTSEDESDALKLAQQLCDLNNQRKSTEDKIMQEIALQIESNPKILNERVLIFSGNNFHHGVIGIVASRICEKYDKPCFVISNEEESSSRGSARGIGSFSIFKCLEYCSSVLERFGGHQGAGGFSLKTENLQEFTKLILQYADDTFNIMPRTSFNIDKVISPNEITLENIKGLSILEPFGEGNKEPTFAIMHCKLLEVLPLANNTSVKFKVQYQGKYLDILCFRKSSEEIFLRKNSMCDFLVKLSINFFKGRESITIMAIDYRMSGVNQAKFFSALDIYERFSLGKDISKTCYEKITPSYDDLKLVYSYIARLKITDTETLFLTINKDSMNYCKLRLCVDIFYELGLLKFDVTNQAVTIVSVDNKVDLNGSSILRRLKDYGE